MGYEMYTASAGWKKRRNKKLRNAVWVGRRVLCRGCHCFVLFSSGDVHVHHLTYDRIGREIDSDLAVLCSGCHAFVHGHEPPDWWKEARASGMLGVMKQPEVVDLVRQFVEDGETAMDAAMKAAFLLCPRIGPNEHDTWLDRKNRKKHISQVQLAELSAASRLGTMSGNAKAVAGVRDLVFL